MELKTNQIRTDGGTQARAQLDNEAVQEYRDILKENGTAWPFPPVVVFHDGSDYWLADGFHRIAAARQHGRFVVEADVRQGQQRDAILYAAGANADHGLKRTAEDKRRAVMRLLEDGEWGKWSDREIARRCKVSPNFVGGLRLTAHEDSEKEERVYTTKHGTVATMKTAAIGSGNRIEIDKGRAYDWLRDYEDDKGRTWQDLEENQVHHANSPCYQAYVRAFPDQVDPKFYLKYALYRLQREEKEAAQETLTLGDLLEKATAYHADNRAGAYLSAFVHSLDLNGVPYVLQEAREAFAKAQPLPEETAVSNKPDLEIWEIESLVRQWHGTRPPIRADALYNLEYFCDWLERNNHNARRNHALQALNNVKSRGQRKEETAVSSLDPATAEIEEITAPQADAVFDYLKQAEKALGRAVSGFDINKGRDLFFKLNDSYNKLLNAIHEYEMTP